MDFLTIYLVIVFGLTTVGYLLITIHVCLDAKRGNPIEETHSIPAMMVLQPIMLGHLIGTSVRTDTAYLQPHTTVLLLLWMVCLCCYLLQEKVKSAKGWKQYMMSLIDHIMEGIQVLRSALIGISERCSTLPFLAKNILFLIGIGIVVATAMSDSPDPMVYLLAIFGYVLFVLCRAVHSCRVLLRCWFVWGGLFALYVVGYTRQYPVMAEQHWVCYLLFVMIFTYFWVVTAGVADYKVVKLASNIVNTATTLILLVVNVVCLQLSLAGGASGVLTVGQQGFNLVLLPVTVGGYVASLFKEVQQYWEEKRG